MGVAAIVPILTVAAAGVSAYSSVSQGNYTAAVARNNAIIAKRNADFALQRGQAEEQAKRTQATQTIGTARAIAGASGVESESGSPLRTEQDIAKLGELDAMTIRHNARREAYAYETQSMGFNSQAGMDSAAGNLDAFASIMGGASSVADKWMRYKQSGVVA